MALVTVQRSPSPSTDLDSEAPDGEEGGSGRSPLRNRSLSESYFTVRGAALILPQGERPRRSTKKSHGGDIQHHLQSMLYLLKHEDRIKVAVKLESTSKEGHQRYMALVSTVGRQDTEESVILGIDYLADVSTIGLVLPIYNGIQIRLDGDGGFCVKVSSEDRKYLFKPVSVQAMWSALQSLQKAVKVAEDETYIPNGLTHTWVQYYTSQIDNSKPDLVNQWNVMEGVEISLSGMVPFLSDADDEFEVKAKITSILTQVMMQVDLDLATSRSLREAVEEKLGHSIKSFRQYFDSEMMRIFGQMDSPSQILDFLFLGTEWNASNIDELTENGVKYILNVTREIDNFFPGQMKYMNVRVYDVDESQLLPHWEKTYRFISKARKNGAKVLVHCKRGISRSASTVIAYLMKENKWSLDDALDFVNERRNIINPNPGFMEQLHTYEGILNASNQRHIFKSQSAENILDKANDDDELPDGGVFLEGADLYHQMFDSAYPQPASEEEVLRSLGKGRGLEEEDRVRIGDLETGSRSTDSLEESLPDIPSPTPDQQEFTTKKKISTKGNYSLTTQYDSAVATSGEVAGLDLIRQEYISDAEDETSGVVPRGRWSQNSSPVISISEYGHVIDSNLDMPMVSSQSRLRPDNSWIKLETENEEEKTVGEAAATEPTLCASPPIFVIGDDFSSPMIPESKDEYGSVGRQSPVLTLTQPPESKSARVRSSSLGDGKTADESAKSETDLNKLSIRNRTASLGNRKINQNEPVPEPIIDVEENVESSVNESETIDRKAQLGIRTYYTREQIPWCPGTVKKMKSDFSKNCQGSDEESDSGQKDSKPEKDDVPEEDNNVMEVTGPPLPPMEDNSIGLTQSCIELLSHDEDDTDSAAALSQKRPKSVYEEEEIEFAEGFVRKFKDRLEGNSSESGSTESRPIQRSASLKEERESLKAKRSERRKTCSPILSPCISPRQEEQKSDTINTVSDTSDKDAVPAAPLESQDGTEGETTGEADKNYTLIKYGSEEVPLEKGLVRKHKQDFESRTDLETRKRLSSESSVSSMVVDPQDPVNPSKDDVVGSKAQSPETITYDQGIKQSGQTSANSSPSHDPIPSMSAADNTEYSNSSVVSERLIGTVKEQTSILEGKETSELEPAPGPVIRVCKKSKKEESSSVDPQTLAKMRELGSELLNQPKIESEEEKWEDLTLVKQVVRSIEKETMVKKPERKIIIIEEGTGKKTDSKSKGQNQPLSEKSRSLDDSGNIGAKRTRQWVRDGGSTSFESSELVDKESRVSRVGLSLNLDEHSAKTDPELGQQSSVESISPRSDSEPSIVRHLVGRFEKDIKSPMSDGTGSNRSSLSVSEFGLCFIEAKKKKGERSLSDVEMRSKSSTSDANVSRPLRPKSADHISKHDHRSQLKGQGREDNQASSSESHIQDSESSDEVRKVRRLHGQTKPVIQRLGASPFYNTM